MGSAGTQFIVSPPETLIACPVIKLASRMARKATSDATSSGLAGLLKGIRRMKDAQPSVERPGGGSSVSLVGPRHTEFTVT